MFILPSTFRRDSPFANNVDQDQTAQNVQSDLGSTLSDMELYFSQK